MGAIHYKGIRIKQNKSEVIYRYFPNYIEDENVFGEFTLGLIDWEPKITIKSDNKFQSEIFSDERCVKALLYKIRKHFEQNAEMPKEVYWIA